MSNLYISAGVLILMSLFPIERSFAAVHLVCRGGSVGNNSLNIDLWEQAYADTRATITYQFERFPGPASAINTRDRSYLSPGQCSYSTGVIGFKSQNYFIHYLGSDPHVSLVLEFVPVRKNGVQDMESMYINFLTRKQMPVPAYPYIPRQGGGEGTDPALAAGTILDQNMIFDFWVQIVNGVLYVDHMTTQGTPLK